MKRRGRARGVDVSCPPLLHDYNTGMGEVDLSDRQKNFTAWIEDHTDSACACFFSCLK